MNDKSLEIWNNLPEIDKTNFEVILNDYVFELRKGIAFRKLNQETIATFINSVSFLSNVEENELNGLKKQKEFIELHKLLRDSKSVGQINPKIKEIYQNNIQKLSRILKIKRARIKHEILGKQWHNYKYLQKTQKEKAEEIFNSCLTKANFNLQEIFKLIEIDISLCDNNYYLDELTNDILGVETNHRDILESIAFTILRPEHILAGYFHYHESWKTFPLKWFIKHMPIDQAKTAFYYYRKGHDLSKLIEDHYITEDFKSLLELLDNPYLSLTPLNIVGGFKQPANEAIQCFREGNYISSLLTLYPTIEGILWEFSKILHKKKFPLYSNNSYKYLLSSEDKELEKSVGNLFRNTAMKQLIDVDFIDYFCDEFYNDRNPKLHGENLSGIKREDVIKKIVTLNYVLDLSKRTMTQILHEVLSKTEINNILKDKLNTLTKR